MSSHRLTNETPLPCMTGAYLERADWSGLDLSDGQFAVADLSFANLNASNLERADGMSANFHAALLARANLREFKGHEARFTQAIRIR